MQRFLSLALALCLGLTFSVDADARRFGGGKSFGSMKHRQTQQQQQAPAAQPNKPAPAAGAKPAFGGIGGMLMGLAAGGLLASLFMGGGFEGLQIMDMLIFGLIGFVIFKLIASRRRQMPQAATAGGPALQREAHSPAQNIFGSAAPAAATAAQPVINAPAWFNESSFLQAAEGHFNALQQHWDANEMEQIAEFVTPEMLTFLSNERSSLGDEMQSTYIDDLSLQLDGVDEENGVTIATLTFHGVAKTSRFDQGEAFSESWRMERQSGDNQPWLIAGIRQNA
ncbi:MAG: TIM44-like domain-containing protein [Pseudomonas sp.]|jgi:predicted lipid-binding transport protein (Tim44 family)|nr:TIM44-like domain-containing protein [Pseudomonas sp.]MDD2223057.1 TIM44-like domain-containing protein [Pseudomonas sp.]MDY0415231.1 TIM44-like domain-containing protein [Pseudomonas sp.]NLO53704.1 TIM44-like domain-containing protein [Gammaproteobacteria bacterium]